MFIVVMKIKFNIFSRYEIYVWKGSRNWLIFHNEFMRFSVRFD
jgi:hypothetical protein